MLFATHEHVWKKWWPFDIS